MSKTKTTYYLTDIFWSKGIKITSNVTYWLPYSEFYPSFKPKNDTVHIAKFLIWGELGDVKYTSCILRVMILW